ncbi:MAG: hypothetical protein AAGD18_15040 [Actinomycetota bacterium]
MNYRSIAQLADEIVAWSRELPRDIELIVGLPRSGLLVANVLSLYRNVPVTDLDGFLGGRTIGAGSTRENPLHRPQGGGRDPESVLLTAERFLDRPRRVLVVDDSIWSGETLRLARKAIEAADLPHHVTYGAVYVTPDTTELADHHREVLPAPRCFEWNVLHHHALRRACVAFEGFLVPGRGHGDALPTRPLHRPTTALGHVVSERPEADRTDVERWLAEHDIEVAELIMTDAPPAAASAHKARVFRDTEAAFFVEGDLGHAVEVANLAGRDVLCAETMQMIRPGAIPVARPGLRPVDEVASRRTLRLVRRMIPARARTRLAGARRRRIAA